MDAFFLKFPTRKNLIKSWITNLVYFHNGEDGIISYLVNNLDIENNFFIEFGVANYLEFNTRFLLKKFNWSGLI